ncbi:MAG: T9SS type A sorting domain-containing protein [Candidatus Neomarinimicrobiota bacterium]|uniref:LTD domain-containing protein n=1 Tax=marine metagenome TaxID=408172 RepID=A0A381STX6_9ZZZZ|nr:T9SS type A sorting domain-containing protein [Candidatus Neomarinimicrobiota bacterium]MEC9274408.1 T9SS type A sorting domain-containing protein [Candidatus Neomarinimicrobiota bacterium]|tara:strand:+ start:4215 stop:5297 length:1083 start_codon:yes stop_codon:yes gene_type:complete
MLKRLLIILSFMVPLISAQDLFISDWYAGTRESPFYNQMIELFNPTDNNIDLSDYALIKGSAGGPFGVHGSHNTFVRLYGTLESGSTVIITRAASHESITSLADIILSDIDEEPLKISGDDAVGLFKGVGISNDDVSEWVANAELLDAVGDTLGDPGTSWHVSGEVGPLNSDGTSNYGVTRFAILTRKETVCIGNAGNWDVSRGCVDDTCSSTSADLSEWNVTALYYSTEPGLENPEYVDAEPDMDLIAGWHYYDCQTVSNQEEAPYPSDFHLKQNYPNPFNPETNIAFSIMYAGNAILSIYNMNGENVWELKMPSLIAGNYTVPWNGRNMDGSRLESGIYIYRLTINEVSQSRKLILLK